MTSIACLATSNSAMTTAAPPSPAASPETSQLVLRVQIPGQDERTVRLSAAKCTIGSLPSCKIRLTGDAIQPLHCSILIGRSGTVAHAWGPARLNGSEFTETQIQAGDVLAIGSATVEVLQTLANLNASPKTLETPATNVPVSQGPSSDSMESNEISATGESRRLQQIRESRDSLRRRTWRVISKLRTERWTLAESRADINRHTSTIQSLETQLADILSRLASAAASFSTESAVRNQLELDVTALNLRLAGITLQFDVANTKINDLASQLVNEQATRANEQSQLTSERVAHAETKQQLQQTVAQFQESKTQWQQSLNEQANLAETLRSETTALREQANAASNSWEQERTALLGQVKQSQLQTEAFTTARTQVSELEAERSVLQTQIATLTMRCEELSTAHDNVVRQLNTERQQQQRFQIELENTERRLNELVAQQTIGETDRAALAEFQARVVDVEQVNTSLRSQVATLESDLQSARATIEAKQAQLAAAEEHARTQIAAATNIPADNSELEALRQQMSQTQAETARERLEKQSLERQARDFETQTRELQEQVDDLNQQRSHWESERRRLAFAERLHLTTPVPNVADEPEEATLAEADAPAISPQPEAAQPEPTVSAATEVAQLAPAETVLQPADEQSTTSSSTDSPAAGSAAAVIARLSRAGIFRDSQPESLEQPREDEQVAYSSRLEPSQSVVATSETEELPSPSVVEEEPKVVENTRKLPAIETNEIEEEPVGLRTATLLKSRTAPEHSSSLGRSLPSSHTSSHSSPHNQAASSVIPKRGEDQEESIEEYMARLMRRVRGDEAANTYQESTAQQTATQTGNSDAYNKSVAARTRQETPAPVEPEPKREYVPRQVPPEFTSNLAAMRELANNSARSAIEVSQVRSWRDTSRAKLIAAGGAGVIGTIIFCMASVEHPWQYGGSLASFGIATYWMFQAKRLARRARKHPLSAPAKQAEGETDPR